MKEDLKYINDKQTNKNKNRILCVIATILWIIFIGILYVVNILMGISENIIILNTSEKLWIFIYVIVPWILLFLPLAIKLFWKIKYLKSLLISFIVSIIYIIALALLINGLSYNFRSFSTSKWLKHEENRYLMINDLEQKYELIGMKVEEVEKILGTDWENYSVNDSETKAMYYYIKGLFMSTDYYVLIYDDDYIITEIKIENIDFM